MAESFYTILTNIGLAAIANAQVTQSKVDFATFVVGDGNGAYYNPTSTQANLVKEVWRGPISGITIDENNANWVIVEAVIPSIAGGFNVREIGVLDSAGQLLAVGKVPETYKPVTAEGSLKDLYLRMILEVSNASVITLKVDPAVIFASKKYVDDQISIKVTPLENHVNNTNVHTTQAEKTSWNNHPKNTVLHTYYNTAGGSANAKTVTLSPAPVGLVDGMAVVFKNTTANTGAVTLNVNSLGAKAIVKANGKALSANNLAVNGIYTVRYNATTGNFILQGEGGIDFPENKIMLVDDILNAYPSLPHITQDGQYVLSSNSSSLRIVDINTGAIIDTKTAKHGEIVSNNQYAFLGGTFADTSSPFSGIYKYSFMTKEVTKITEAGYIQGQFSACDESYLYRVSVDSPPFTSATLEKIDITTNSIIASVALSVADQTNIYERLLSDDDYLYLIKTNGIITKFNKVNLSIVATSSELFANGPYLYIDSHIRHAIDNDFIYVVPYKKSDVFEPIYKVSKHSLALIATSASSYKKVVASKEHLITEVDSGMRLGFLNKTTLLVSGKSANLNAFSGTNTAFRSIYLRDKNLVLLNRNTPQRLLIT